MLYFDFINPWVTYILIMSLFIISIFLIFTKKSFIQRHKKTIFKVAMILLIWTQFARYVGVFFKEDVVWSFLGLHFKIVAFNLATHLPFYICRLSVVVLLYYVITKDKRVESFLFYWGATGISAILYPNGNIQNIFNLTETFYIDHYFLGLTPFFLVVYQGYRPNKNNLLVITGVMFLILTLFVPINYLMNKIPNIGVVDYFYLEDQSIVKVLFGELPKMVFITIHTVTAFCFFSIYYFLFRNKKFEIKKGD